MIPNSIKGIKMFADVSLSHGYGKTGTLLRLVAELYTKSRDAKTTHLERIQNAMSTAFRRLGVTQTDIKTICAEVNHARHLEQDTGKHDDNRPTSIDLATEAPQVIGGEGDGGGGDDGGEESGGDDGGEDDSARHWLIALLLALLRLHIWPIVWLYNRLPDFTVVMREAEEFFPLDILHFCYLPAKKQLLRRMLDARDAEWDTSLGRRLWRGFCRRMHFCLIILKCTMKFVAKVWPYYRPASA